MNGLTLHLYVVWLIKHLGICMGIGCVPDAGLRMLLAGFWIRIHDFSVSLISLLRMQYSFYFDIRIVGAYIQILFTIRFLQVTCIGLQTQDRAFWTI